MIGNEIVTYGAFNRNFEKMGRPVHLIEPVLIITRAKYNSKANKNWKNL